MKTSHPLVSLTLHPGGSNPAIRTLFYRLVRLLSLTITPIFVFDGPNKPAFKRNKRSRGPGDSVSAAMAKRMFRLFGFACHDAPGEAEAECALLQRAGVVDAVLSEDVDTIMFGCTRTLRNWSAEGTRAAKTPTHVSVYDVADLRQGETGLDREGMVLVALMSGGDYIPEGVPGCGVKVACEAAKAGFGTRLCRIKRSDPEALREWRADLIRELKTNESKFFRVRHKALTIPEEFPDIEVLRYYTHPVVSQAATVESLRTEFPSRREIDIVGLRAFTAETFDWTYKVGAIKFIRVLGPSLLVQALMDLSRQDCDSDDPDVREEMETTLVRSIKSRRIHISTDSTSELRVAHVPNDIVGLDLDAEEDEPEIAHGRSGLALNSDDEGEEQFEDGEDQPKTGPRKIFDPLQSDLAWVPETVAKLGVPLLVEDWEGKQRMKGRKAPAKRLRKNASEMPVGSLDKYVRSTKPSNLSTMKGPEIPAFLLSASQPPSSLPPLSRQLRAISTTSASRDVEGGPYEPTAKTQYKSSKTSKRMKKPPAPRKSADVNPWSIASSQTTPKAARSRSVFDTSETIIISSSPVPAHSPSPAMTPAETQFNNGSEPQSSALLTINDNSQTLPTFNNPLSPASSPPPTFKPTAAVVLSPRKHNRCAGDTIGKPAAKRPQRSNNGAAAVRSGSPTRRSTRSGRVAQTTKAKAAQPSIKAFGRLTEAMGKKNAAHATKPNSPVDLSSEDDDDELEDMRTLGSRKTTEEAADIPSTHPASFPRPDSGVAVPPAHKTVPVAIEIPSSPPGPPSPFASSSKARTTRVYMPRTSGAGLGYFKEVEVTREEADRMMMVMSEEAAGRGKRPGGGSWRRMWRESEVTILDLTGED